METKDIKLLQGIDTVIVRVSQIESSKQFYVGKLGLVPIWDDPATKLVVLDTKGPTSLTLWQTEKKPAIDPDTASYPIFKTPDASALRQELLARGIEAGEISQDEHVKFFFFYDPDGNVLEACEVHE